MVTLWLRKKIWIEKLHKKKKLSHEIENLINIHK